MVSPTLLRFNIVNTKLDYQINDGGLQRRPMPDTQYYQQKTNDTYIEITTQDAVITVDTYEARASMGYGELTDEDMIKRRAQEGKEACAEGTRKSVQYGNMLRDLIPPSEISRRRMQEQFASATAVITTFFPKGGADITVERGGAESEYTPTTIDFNWEDALYDKHEFIRPSVNFNVVQRAYVDIQYMGDPIYSPPSAKPDFEIKA